MPSMPITEVLIEGPPVLKEFWAYRLVGREELSRPFRFRVDLRSEDPRPVSVEEIADFLQTEAVLIIRVGAGLRLGEGMQERRIKGVISAACHLGREGTDHSHIRITITHPLAFAGLSRVSRTFREKKTSDVVRQLLQQRGIACDMAATSFAPALLLQHQESDLAFLNRLLASEGLFYRHDSDKDSAKLIIGGSTQTYASGRNAVPIEMFPQGRSEYLGVHYREIVVPRRIGITDDAAQNPHKPHHDIGTVRTLKPGKGTVSEHYHIGDAASWTASQGVEPLSPARHAAARFSAHQAVFTGTCSDACHVQPGVALRIDSSSSLDGVPLLVCVSARHAWSSTKGFYRTSFTAIAYDGPVWHPRQQPAPPHARGLRLGVVVGNNVPGDETKSPYGNTPSHAVYEVKFPQECGPQDEPVTQYARFAASAAGPGRGLHVPLEIGDQVVVANHLGDPNRPVIIGVLYHRQAASPRVGFKDSAVTSSVLRSRTGHELRLDDADDQQAMTLTSGSTDHQFCLDDTNKKVELKTKGDHIVSVDGMHQRTVKKDVTTKIDGAQEHTVAKDVTAKIDGALKLDVTKDTTAKITGALNLGVTKAIAAKTDQGLEVAASQAITVEATTGLTLKCGNSSITLKPDGSITIAGTQIKIDAQISLQTTSVTTEMKADTSFDVTGGQLALAGKLTAELSAPKVDVSGDLMASLSAPKVDVSGDAAASVSAPKLDLSGSAMTTITGALVKIN